MSDFFQGHRDACRIDIRTEDNLILLTFIDYSCIIFL